MMNKMLGLILTLMLSFSVIAQEYTLSDVVKVQNDKEVHSVLVTKKIKKKILKKSYDTEFVTKLTDIFYQSLLSFINNSNLRCELNFVEIFKTNLEGNHLNHSENDLNDYFYLLRINNKIDDLLLEFSLGINKDLHELNKMDQIEYYLSDRQRYELIRPSSSHGKTLKNRRNKLLEFNNVEEIFSNFKVWPDEVNQCLYQEINFMKTALVDYQNPEEKINAKRKWEIIELLSDQALLDGHISPRTYKKLKYLREVSFISKRYLRFEDYLNIVFKAKNKLKSRNNHYEIRDLSQENPFSTEKFSRFSKLTRRKDLYEKYNETQIIMLAQVLQRASIRMGVDPDVEASRPVITQEFSFINENGERENYVERLELDPRSQFNLARKRMRKDILDLEAMDLFYKMKIYYDEIVMAAFETGYLTFEDIEHAVKYDDLWNPTKSSFERVMGYIFSITGYATFFIPPPYNVPATLGIAIVQGFINSKNIKGENNDNPATFID